MRAVARRAGRIVRNPTHVHFPHTSGARVGPHQTRILLHRSVLLIDDDETSLLLLRRFFERLGWRVQKTRSPQEAIAFYEGTSPPLVILDLHMPVLSGLELLEILRSRDPDPAIVMLTGQADVETAVTAMRLGAENYLTKPVALDHLEAIAEKAFETVGLRRSNRALTSQQVGGGSPTAAALRRSQVMREMEEQVERVASSQATVLLVGETGTGKSWLARSIHQRSARARAPFIEVNCAGLSRENLEHKLFGEERITSRGRRVEPRGLFELADGGTILLDQVGMLDRELQPRLLQVLETGRFRRVGGTEEVEVDVRIIAATTSELQAQVQMGEFREDLYYRLAVVPLHLPPLREQTREEVLGTARALLGGLSPHLGGEGSVGISAAAEDLLARYDWPGNIREMRNLLERVLILHPRLREIGVDELPAEVRSGEVSPPPRLLDPTLPMEEVERMHILAALRHFGGNRSAAARSLRIARRTLYEKIERYAMDSIE
jgi:DNA-binding NtrC family response regulator